MPIILHLLKYANVIAQYEKISDKYKTIAEYIGLGQEGGNSFLLLELWVVYHLLWQAHSHHSVSICCRTPSMCGGSAEK